MVDTGGLVKASPKSDLAGKVWSKEAFSTGKTKGFRSARHSKVDITLDANYFSVPHFLIIHASGKMEDYSSDAEASGAITTYPDWPSSGADNPYLFIEQEMKLIAMDGDLKLHQWFFDTNSPVPLGYANQIL